MGNKSSVTDEKSLLIWLYQFLETPQTYSDIYTASRKIISGVEDDIPELRELLDQNLYLKTDAIAGLRPGKRKRRLKRSGNVTYCAVLIKYWQLPGPAPRR